MAKHSEQGAVRATELAKILAVSKGRVSQLTAAGMPKRPDGLFDVAEAQAWVFANVERRPARQSAPQSPVASFQTPASDYAALRAEHEALKRDLTALKVAQETGAIVRKDDVQAAIYARARLEREAHENFVIRTAPLLAAELGIAEASMLAALDKHMRQHLEDLSRMPLEMLSDDD